MYTLSLSRLHHAVRGTDATGGGRHISAPDAHHHDAHVHRKWRDHVHIVHPRVRHLQDTREAIQVGL